MIVSRALNLMRSSKALTFPAGNLAQVVRHGHHEVFYRTATQKHDKTMILASQGIMAVAWWWILWHLYTEPGHITGEFEYPDASKWTDEELGIPSD